MGPALPSGKTKLWKIGLWETFKGRLAGGMYPQIIHLTRMFPYKPSILGTSILGPLSIHKYI